MGGTAVREPVIDFRDLTKPYAGSLAVTIGFAIVIFVIEARGLSWKSK